MPAWVGKVVVEKDEVDNYNRIEGTGLAKNVSLLFHKISTTG